VALKLANGDRNLFEGQKLANRTCARTWLYAELADDDQE
jgi:hypothetical protein